MIAVRLVCASCGSPHQKNLGGGKLKCESCNSIWFAEGPEVPPPAETIENQEEDVQLVVPPSIKVTHHLREKGYLVNGDSFGHSDRPVDTRMLFLSKERPPIEKPRWSLFGTERVLKAQDPLIFAWLWFDNHARGATWDHWVLEFWGEGNTEEVSALARELADKFSVRIYAILKSA